MAWICQHCKHVVPFANPAAEMTCPICGQRGASGEGIPTADSLTEAIEPVGELPQSPFLPHPSDSDSPAWRRCFRFFLPKPSASRAPEEPPEADPDGSEELIFPWVSLSACLLCALIFLGQHVIGPNHFGLDPEWVTDTFGFIWQNEHVAAPWQWLTGAFLHYNFAHLFGNLAAGLCLAVFVQPRIRHFSPLGLILLSAIAGPFSELLFQLFANGALPDRLCVIGFSGVVCAFGGVALFGAPFRILFFLLPSFIPGGVNTADNVVVACGAHLGGFLLGVFFGLVSIFAGRRTFLAILIFISAILFILLVLLFLLVAAEGSGSLSGLPS